MILEKDKKFVHKVFMSVHKVFTSVHKKWVEFKEYNPFI